jgi:hypothetical protein
MSASRAWWRVAASDGWPGGDCLGRRLHCQPAGPGGNSSKRKAWPTGPGGKFDDRLLGDPVARRVVSLDLEEGLDELSVAKKRTERRRLASSQAIASNTVAPSLSPPRDAAVADPGG